MTKNKNFLKLLVVIIFVVLASGCTQNSNNQTGVKSGSDLNKTDTIDDKNREITLTGKISKSGSLYLITTQAGKIQDLESYTIDFDSYLGQTVTVVGEFSGDTLFVTQVE